MAVLFVLWPWVWKMRKVYRSSEWRKGSGVSKPKEGKTERQSESESEEKVSPHRFDGMDLGVKVFCVIVPPTRENSVNRVLEGQG